MNIQVNKPLKVFFSQPFHNRTEEEIFAERRALVDWIERTWLTPVDIVDQYHQVRNDSLSKTLIMAQDILLMGMCDVILFHPDWHMSTGCKIEMDVANKYLLNWYILRKEQCGVVEDGVS